jgi:acetylornithine deacetylase/succinyl-diaminopimelate desuccinylase-like protein
MNVLRALLGITALGVASCGRSGVAPSPPASPAPRAAAATRPFEEEARALLEQLVRVDTSHGSETKALEPVAAMLKSAGVPVRIVESSPGRGNLIARVKGDGSKRPLLLLAHVDVVPIEGQPWTVPPFTPTEKDGFLSARGVADDKSMVAAFTAIVLEIARTKTKLSRDVILALTAGEETGGFAGVQWLVKNDPEIREAEIALNEGGPLVTSADFGEVLVAGLGVAEKSYQSYRIVARGRGGHSSIPTPGEDPIASLSRALVKVSEHRFPAKVLPEVRTQLEAAASWEHGEKAAALKHAAQTAPRLAPEDERVLSADRTYGALVRTTCVATMLKGSPQDNVLPTSAEAVVNCRILPDETREQTLATLRAAIGDASIEIGPVDDQGVGPSAPLDGDVPAIFEKVAREHFPKAKIVTSMSTGATDSRHLRAAGILRAYGTSCAPTSLEEARAGRSAHGPDERRPVKWLAPGARFLRDLTLALAR